MLHRVKDLSPEQKLAVESLLGHPISEDEFVSIKRLQSGVIIPSKLSPEERLQALQKLNAIFAAVQVESPNVSEEEAESIINEALRTTRPNDRPVGSGSLIV